jgi:hypothetical protein
MDSAGASATDAKRNRSDRAFPILRAEYRHAGLIAAIRRQLASVRVELHPARRLSAYHPAFV